MLTCTICSGPFPFHRPCEQAHPGVCHACASLNWSGTPLDNPAHIPPPELPTLSAREIAAVAAYTAHVRRVVGGRALADLVTEEGTP